MSVLYKKRSLMSAPDSSGAHRTRRQSRPGSVSTVWRCNYAPRQYRAVALYGPVCARAAMSYAKGGISLPAGGTLISTASSAPVSYTHLRAHETEADL
eukprot:2567868-Rhodomonas_salina.2